MGMLHTITEINRHDFASVEWVQEDTLFVKHSVWWLLLEVSLTLEHGHGVLLLLIQTWYIIILPLF